jgi:flavin reductase (DIM6/NTAB) family NADH-FMN oxidoreductase RutF
LPTDPIADTLAAPWSPLLAITTHHQGRSNGMVAATGVFASLVPEAPRVLVEITKTSLTQDLVLASRVFALHTLPATPDEALTASLSLVRALGLRSGHDGDKMAGIPARAGLTASPILTETTAAENCSPSRSCARTFRRNGGRSGRPAGNVK